MLHYYIPYGDGQTILPLCFTYLHVRLKPGRTLPAIPCSACAERVEEAPMTASDKVACACGLPMRCKCAANFKETSRGCKACWPHPVHAKYDCARRDFNPDCSIHGRYNVQVEPEEHKRGLGCND